MATSKTNDQSSLDLQHLSQTDVAYLVGKPVSWVKENGHLFPRAADGTYDARAVVAGLIQSRASYADLNDADLEGAMQLGECLASTLDKGIHGGIRVLTTIRERYGAAGMAAAAEAMTSELVAWVQHFGIAPPGEPPTPDDIRAAALERAEREIREQVADLPNWGAHGDLRVLGTCPKCKRYRFGSSWHAQPVPTGYQTAENLCCPKCERKPQ